jgi:hypothetical protein
MRSLAGRRLVALLAAVAALAVGAVDAAGPPTLDGGAAARQQATRLDPPARSISLVAGGDVLTEERVRCNAARHGAAGGQRFDFAPMFAPVAPIIGSANLAICNTELPIGVPGGAYGYAGRSPYGGNLLLAPYEIAPGLRSAGFDRCSTATNHADDLGVGGISSTIDALRRNGIGTSGTARTPSESIVPIFAVDGVSVAHVSYTTSSNTVVPRESWRLNLTRHARTIASAVEDAAGGSRHAASLRSAGDEHRRGVGVGAEFGVSSPTCFGSAFEHRDAADAGEQDHHEDR